MLIAGVRLEVVGNRVNGDTVVMTVCLFMSTSIAGPMASVVILIATMMVVMVATAVMV